nr:hypothetical protein [Tanacetum cinerariifolium]
MRSDSPCISEDFFIQVEPLFIKQTAKNSSLCIILDSIPELLYVDGRNSSSSSKCSEEVRVLKNVDRDLKDRVLLSLLKIKNSSSSSKCYEEVRVLENVDRDLKDRVLLSLLKIKYTVALPNRHPRDVR